MLDRVLSTDKKNNNLTNLHNIYFNNKQNKPICKPKKGAEGYFRLSCTIHDYPEYRWRANNKEHKRTKKHNKTKEDLGWVAIYSYDGQYWFGSLCSSDTTGSLRLALCHNYIPDKWLKEKLRRTRLFGQSQMNVITIWSGKAATGRCPKAEVKHEFIYVCLLAYARTSQYLVLLRLQCKLTCWIPLKQTLNLTHTWACCLSHWKQTNPTVEAVGWLLEVSFRHVSALRFADFKAFQ